MRVTTNVHCSKCGKNTANGVFGEKDGVRTFICSECFGWKNDYEANFFYRPPSRTKFKELDALEHRILNPDWIIKLKTEKKEE